jgi:hypothetical protein
MSDEIAEQARQVASCLGFIVDHAKRRGRIAFEQPLAELRHGLLRGEAEDAKDIGFVDLFAAEGDELIEHRFGVAHPPSAPRAIASRQGESVPLSPAQRCREGDRE